MSSLGTVNFEIKLETVMEHDDGNFLWFHPRVAVIPSRGAGNAESVVMTLQKHLEVSDHYSGLYMMRSYDLGRTWTGPERIPELDWVREGDVVVSVSDVMPTWHAPTDKLICIGSRSRYDESGHALAGDKPRYETPYAVFDPRTGEWSRWKGLRMPPDRRYDRCGGHGHAKPFIQTDGTLLIPFGYNDGHQSGLIVGQCAFDGKELTFLRHGSVLTHEDGYLSETGMACCAGKYYLTIRRNEAGYVTVSDDGFNYRPIQRWAFDDGSDLGNYRTQQHWLIHSEGLFLVYTRRGADNDHIFRHRAPLFIARVDPGALCVLRSTERVLIPERGATLGNFGTSVINERESWVTVAEGVWDIPGLQTIAEARRRGAKGATLIARVLWQKPNGVASW